MAAIEHSRPHWMRVKKEKSPPTTANYEGSVGLPCAPGVDVYLRTRAMGAQDGSASPIYSAREPVRLCSWDERKRLGPRDICISFQSSSPRWTRQAFPHENFGAGFVLISSGFVAPGEHSVFHQLVHGVSRRLNSSHPERDIAYSDDGSTDLTTISRRYLNRIQGGHCP